eukprot:Skav226992  [mRNA]  locus=scaffold2341:266761:269571:+ [translate_table: standard]
MYCPALKECLKSSIECLPALKQVRYRVWPYVQEQIGWPHKAWEPQDFHPQVAKVQMDCMGQANYTLYLMHVWKAAGWATMENLKAIGKDYVEVPSLQDTGLRLPQADYNWCEQLDLDSVSSKRRSTFTFVREPLSRLISGYAEIERTYKGREYSFLRREPAGDLARAKVFMNRFFQDGELYNGHVTPQSEYFAPFSSECSLPIDFVGKTEQIERDWQRFLESKRCFPASKIPFSNELGQHPTKSAQAEVEEALTQFLNISLLSVNTETTSTLASKASLHKVLRSEGAAYLKAFCWLLLTDYVMFDYDLPKECDQSEMLYVLNLTKVTTVG